MGGLRGGRSTGVHHHEGLECHALDPGSWYSTVCVGGCRFYTAAWVRKEGETSENRQKQREEAEEVDKVEVLPAGGTVGSLRRFRAALIGPTQGLPKRCELCW